MVDPCVIQLRYTSAWVVSSSHGTHLNDIYIWSYIYLYISVNIYTYIYIYIYIFTYTHVCKRTSLYKRTHKHKYTHLYMHTYTYKWLLFASDYKVLKLKLINMCHDSIICAMAQFEVLQLKFKTQIVLNKTINRLSIIHTYAMTQLHVSWLIHVCHDSFICAMTQFQVWSEV